MCYKALFPIANRETLKPHDTILLRWILLYIYKATDTYGHKYEYNACQRRHKEVIADVSISFG